MLNSVYDCVSSSGGTLSWVGFFLVFFAMLALSGFFRKNPETGGYLLSFPVLLLLLIFKLSLTYFFFFISEQSLTSVDSIRFYARACEAPGGWLSTYGVGISAMVFLVYPLVNFLDFSYFQVCVCFSVVSFIAVNNVLKVLSNARYHLVGPSAAVLLFIVFLPSLNYWTSSISKDVVSLYAMSVVMLLLVEKRKSIDMLAAVFFVGVVVGHVRPYMFFVIYGALGIVYVVSSDKMRISAKFALILVVIGASYPVLTLLVEHAGLEEVSFSSVENRISDSVDRWGGGSYVDISQYPLPLKIFTFLFRPLFFDSSGAMGFIASFENMIVLLAFCYMSYIVFSNKSYRTDTLARKYLLIFFLLGSVLLSLITPNLGTASRKKVVFIFPVLIYLLAASTDRKTATRVGNKKDHIIRVSSG